MVIVQTGSELTLNIHLNTYSSYCKEAGPELFFNAYLSCYHETMIGHEQLPQDASDAQGGDNNAQSLSFCGIQGQELHPPS